MKHYKQIWYAAIALTLLASCGTHKNITNKKEPIGGNVHIENNQSIAQKKIKFIQKVTDQALYQNNLVADLTFSLNTNSKNLSVPGILRMRKDEVIRLQLLIPLLRTEVGRIEFTKDYVLFIDRMNKEYVKASYNEVAFLKENGINFYTLQALFWNQLFLPGQQKVRDNNIQQFEIELDNKAQGNNQTNTISYEQGKLGLTWVAEAATGLITSAQAKYASGNHGSSMITWDYSNFQRFGTKQYPNIHQVKIETNATKQKKSILATFELNKINDKSDWESFTTPSDKYQKVAIEEILSKLIKL